VGDVSIDVEHLAKFSVPGMKLSDKVMEKIRSKISTLKRSYGGQEKYISKSSATSVCLFTFGFKILLL